MKRIITFLAVVAVLITSLTSAFAVNPTVPLEVAIKGRQSVTDYMNHQIDHVNIKFKGDSVVRPSWQDVTFDRAALRYSGYVHDGSFSEFSQAMYSTAFSGDVIQTPAGYYDVRAQIEVFNTNNETVLLGDGYLNIYRDSGGNLEVGKFEPYLSIPETINVAVPSDVDAAKWVSQFGGSRELQPQWDGKGGSIIPISSSLLENGFLLYTKNGHILGYDLKSGATLSGQRIYAVLGNTRSGDTEILRDPTIIDGSNYLFSQYGKQVVGRFPLRDVVLSQGVSMRFLIEVPIWGSSSKLVAKRIWIKPIYVAGGSKMDDGVWYEVPSHNGFFYNVYLPAGEYSIRTEFEGLVDWEELNGTDGGFGGKG